MNIKTLQFQELTQANKLPHIRTDGPFIGEEEASLKDRSDTR